MGAAALDLSWVACGRTQGFFEYHLEPWDFAAGSLIIEEAGGRCADRYGKPLTLQSKSVLVATPAIFDELVELAAWRD